VVTPIFFLGEMVFPWMFEGDYACLLPFREVAHILAHHRDWPKLYDAEALRNCHVPCAAAVYYDDMWVVVAAVVVVEKRKTR